jgi:hypothetical protein
MADGAQDGCSCPRYGAGEATLLEFSFLAIVKTMPGSGLEAHQADG